MIKPRLLIFAKSPTPGFVKTRLMKAMSPEIAATIYVHLLSHTLTQSKLPGVEAIVWRSGDVMHPYWQAWPEYDYCEQPEGDLGDRMAYAIEHSAGPGGPVVLIGSDCLALTAEYIQQAFTALAAGSDIVLGPATDGGYVLIGLNKPHQQLFRGISWSTDQVFAQTVSIIESSGLTYNCLAELSDIDTIADAIAADLFSSSQI